ncbi:UNVERIFIED_CONTAM: cell wall-associated NlpC family hydrolase [Brevibacillus sp. OAP136]
MKTAIISVSVATVWTNPEKPLEKDQAALTNPVDVRGWLGSLSVEEKLGFYDNNAIQTQALYGTRVEIMEEQGEWAHILIPDQQCRKDERGYPGWVPSRQLATWNDAFDVQDGQQMAQVTASFARLHNAAGQPGIELAFLTRLPILAENDGWVKVATTDGEGFLRREDLAIVQANRPVDIKGNRGEAIVESGKRFLNLHYLWGGMSSYGYDCSGFAYNMHRSVGIQIPRDAVDQAQAGQWVEKSELQPGDLLFFAHEEGKGRVHHVGIYYGNNQMIHSPDSLSSIEIVNLTGYKLEKEHVISRRYW